MIKWTHALEQLTQSIAQYCSVHPCTKRGFEDACEKGLGSPMFDKLRTVQECYECQRRWAEEWLSKKEEEENAGHK